MSHYFNRKILTICILTLFAFIALPREYYTGDLVLHLPILTMHSDARSFSADYLRQFRLPDLNPSIYYPVLTILFRVFSGHEQLLFSLLRFFYLSCLFSILFLLSMQLQISFFVYTIFSLLLISHVQVGGSGISIIESEFLPRGFGLVLILLSCYLFSIKNYKTGLAVLISSVLLHGMTTFFAVWISIGLYLNKYRNSQLAAIAFALFLTICAVVWICVTPVDPNWLAVLRMRNSYAFIDTWSTKAWINLSLILTPGLVYLFIVKTKTIARSIIMPVYAGALALLIIQFLFTFVKPIYPAILLQLGRVWLFPALISLLALAHLISRYSKGLNKMFIIIGLGLLVLMVNNRPRISMQAALPSAWLSAQEWARNNSSQSCLFLVPFSSIGFRIESKRSIVGEYKDGTLSFYSRDFAREWLKRYEVLLNWEKLDSKNLLELASLYHFDYFVLPKENKFTDFPVQYSNDSYAIQSITSEPKCELKL